MNGLWSQGGAGNWARLCLGISFVALLGFPIGCASSGTSGNSGFLGDYSQLTPGQPGQAKLYYVDPTVAFGGYTEILMDPVEAYASGPNSSLNRVPEDKLQALLTYFNAAIRWELQNDYSLVKTPGPHTMRLRVALTEAKGAKENPLAHSMDMSSGLALEGLKKSLESGGSRAAITGAEMELLDALSGKRLAAAVDERVGSQAEFLGQWESAQRACDYWAGRLRARLAELRAR